MSYEKIFITMYFHLLAKYKLIIGTFCTCQDISTKLFSGILGMLCAHPTWLQQTKYMMLKQNVDAYQYNRVPILFAKEQHNSIYFMFYTLTVKKMLDRNIWSELSVLTGSLPHITQLIENRESLWNTTFTNLRGLEINITDTTFR